ncbi:MAG: hypothetical protein RLZZ546_1780, partial [Bacteroidota bacterium]
MNMKYLLMRFILLITLICFFSKICIAQYYYNFENHSKETIISINDFLLEDPKCFYYSDYFSLDDEVDSGFHYEVRTLSIIELEHLVLHPDPY